MTKIFCDNCEAELTKPDRDTKHEFATEAAKGHIMVTILFRYPEYDQPHPALCGTCAKDFARQAVERITSGRKHAS